MYGRRCNPLAYHRYGAVLACLRCIQSISTYHLRKNDSRPHRRARRFRARQAPSNGVAARRRAWATNLQQGMMGMEPSNLYFAGAIALNLVYVILMALISALACRLGNE